MGVKTVVVIVLLMLSTGCSGSSKVDLPTPTVQPTLTSPSTVPTSPKAQSKPLTTKQAAEAYLAAVRPRNSALTKFNEDWKGSAPVETLRAAAARMLAAERQFLAALDNTTWPPSIAENAGSLATCITLNVSWYESATRINESDEIRQPPPCGGGDAQLIRIRLQLPSD